MIAASASFARGWRATVSGGQQYAASLVTNIMQPAVDAVFAGKAEASSLSEANTQVNALFGG